MEGKIRAFPRPRPGGESATSAAFRALLDNGHYHAVLLGPFKYGRLSLTVRDGGPNLPLRTAALHTRANLRFVKPRRRSLQDGAYPAHHTALAGVLAAAQPSYCSSFSTVQAIERHASHLGQAQHEEVGQLVEQHARLRTRPFAARALKLDLEVDPLPAADREMAAELADGDWPRPNPYAKRHPVQGKAFPRCLHSCGYKGCLTHVAFGTQACDGAHAAVHLICLRPRLNQPDPNVTYSLSTQPDMEAE